MTLFKIHLSKFYTDPVQLFLLRGVVSDTNLWNIGQNKNHRVHTGSQLKKQGLCRSSSSNAPATCSCVPGTGTPAQFLRTGGPGHTLELYHDRIREALASQLDPNRLTQIHRRLAQAIEGRGIDDPEALFEHYLGAGERVRAATHAATAAKKAASALAFDRAAAFYRRALELAPARDAEQVDLKLGLADALVNAGRPAEAAQAYLDVAQLTSARHSLDFKRRAAQQLLMGGHIEEGLELVRSVLAAVGLAYPAGPRRALFSLLLKRLQIRLRGLNFTGA